MSYTKKGPGRRHEDGSIRRFKMSYSARNLSDSTLQRVLQKMRDIGYRGSVTTLMNRLFNIIDRTKARKRRGFAHKRSIELLGG